MNVDISGPHRTQKAEDQDVACPRYFIVCNYSFPLFQHPLSQTEKEDVPQDVPIPDEFEEEPPEDAVPGVGGVVDGEDWEIAEEPDERGDDWIDEVLNIPLLEILPSKSPQAIISALNRFYAKLREGPAILSKRTCTAVAARGQICVRISSAPSFASGVAYRGCGWAPVPIWLLTGIVKQVMPSLTFNALSLSWCACFKVHRDVHNEWDTPNVVIPFLMPATGGDLWLSLVPGDVVQGEVQLKELPDGKAQAGQVLKLKKWTACSFDARRWHATTSYGPDEQRLVLVAYTAAIMRNLQPGDFEALRAGGFPLGAHTCPAERCVGADLPSSVQPGESALFAVPVLRKSCEPGEQPLVLGKSEAHALPVLGSSGDPGESNTCATHVLATSCELGEQCETIQRSNKPGVRAFHPFPVWYHSVPLPSVEPVDPAILGDMPEVEGDEEDVRDQETALAKDMQAGSQVLAEATANLIARGNAEIQVLEGDLEYLASCENYDPEIEGPQNQDASLRSITVEEGEQLWQTKIVSITDVMADIKSWTPALEAELLSLTEVNEATGVITEDEVRALEADPELHVVRLPGKIVAVIKSVTWEGATGHTMRLVQTKSDVSMWLIWDTVEECIKGSLGVYVDDLLFMADTPELKKAMQAVQGIWTCSAPAFATDEQGLKFCGLQIWKKGDMLHVGQPDYIKDLASRYPEMTASLHLPDLRIDPEPEEVEVSAIRLGQKVVGELTWVANRSRPDISFSVNRLSKLVLKYPKYVLQAGKQLIRYLLATVDLVLRYGPKLPLPQDFVESLVKEPAASDLCTYANASFGQQDGRSNPKTKKQSSALDSTNMPALPSTAVRLLVLFNCVNAVRAQQFVSWNPQVQIFPFLLGTLFCAVILLGCGFWWLRQELKHTRLRLLRALASEARLEANLERFRETVATAPVQLSDAGTVQEGSVGEPEQELGPEVMVGPYGLRAVLCRMGGLVLRLLDPNAAQVFWLRALAGGWRYLVAEAYERTQVRVRPELGEVSEDSSTDTNEQQPEPGLEEVDDSAYVMGASDPYDPYMDLTPSERARVDPNNYNPSPAASMENDGTLANSLRNVLSLNGILMIAYLGPDEPGTWAWHLASADFKWSVPHARGTFLAYRDYLRRQTGLAGPLGIYIDDAAPGLQPELSDDGDDELARAAFLLYQNDLRFDWEQLPERQQDVYHELVGNWLMSISEVD
ncbi:RE1 [Symbiodinium natans]|uniref:RE1 protein n=1 Tax=Symbiodinium natans TaxID=878477 RepID=A0A812PDD4_9DINO|nr:RE1 [Symbiodinium natans]